MKRHMFGFVVAGTVALAVAGVGAIGYVVEPDDYTGDMSAVAPGARLNTLRRNTTHDGFTLSKVYSVVGGSWAPTGTRVFGHTVPLNSGQPAHHWDNLNGAWDCYTSQSCDTFEVFQAYFTEPVSEVKIQTTMRGEMAPDPVELWAFDTSGQRVLQCRLNGVDASTIQSGVLPPPHYVGPLSLPCGKVLEKKNCQSSSLGNCDYVVEMRVGRSAADIKFVWFGGRLDGSSFANVDALTYTKP